MEGPIESRQRPKRDYTVRTESGSLKFGVPIGTSIYTDTECMHPGCETRKFSLGYCKMHYTRSRNGSPPMDAPRRKLKGEAVWSEWRVAKDGYVVRSKQYREDGKHVRLHQSQHRTYWEEAYGPLLEGQNIHHKNGVRSDNRLENLELWDVRQPKGQRPEDKLEYAKEIFLKYAEPGTKWEQFENKS